MLDIVNKHLDLPLVTLGRAAIRVSLAVVSLFQAAKNRKL